MSLTIIASFTQNSGDTPATGLTLSDIALYLYAVNKSTGAVTEIWDGTQNPTAEVDNVGSYLKIYSGDDLDAYDYVAGALYSGGSTLDANWIVGSIGEVPCTFTQSATSIASALSGTDLVIRRGDTLVVYFTDLGDISGRTKLWFTVKERKSDLDSAALIQIEESAGLLYINGESADTPANGSITITDEVAGDLTVQLDEAEAQNLSPQSGYYDVQVLDTGDVATLTAGDASIVGDVTRAVS